jgi:TolB-like protein/DNA-binding winged helix-turn-helix (wHTH) protein/Flp pilus assembly protein TadD
VTPYWGECRSPAKSFVACDLPVVLPYISGQKSALVVNSGSFGVRPSMPEAGRMPARLGFGVFEVDLGRGELRKHGLRVRLQAQPFQVLATLLEHAGEVVTREELQTKLWPADTFVDFDHGLNKAINKIREALGDSAENPRFVETVARRGYRFIAEVRPIGAPAAVVVAPGNETVPRAVTQDSSPHEEGKRERPTRRLRALVFATSIAIVLAVAAGLWIVYSRTRTTSQIRSVAVLPLESLSEDTAQEYFADGITDQLITDLGKISALRVISRTSIMNYKNVHEPLPQIARELGVDAVVEGTVLRSGDRVRITAQLIEAPADKHLWAQSYEGDLRDTLSLQDQVARTIAENIRVRLRPPEEAAFGNRKPVNSEAYVAYLKGRYFWNKRTGEGLQKAIEYFRQAIEEDPGFAAAYAGLADSYALLGNSDFAVLSPREAYPIAKAAATKALELDDSLGEAHTSLAFCLGFFEWRWDAAEKQYLQAMALNPSYATAHQWYALQLSLLGRFDEAISEIRKAESLDPLSLVISAGVADVLFAARRYEEAIRQSRKLIEMDPSFAIGHFELGQALVQTKQYDRAIAELEKGRQLSGGDTTCLATLGYAYAASGKPEKTVELLHELQQRPNHHFSYASAEALIYASLNDKDQAMASLQKAYQDRFDALSLRSPAFDSLRSDPRFRALEQRIGLPQ